MAKARQVIDPFYLFLSIITIAGCYGLFFNPPFSIPHVDDLFFIPWAGELANHGHHTNGLLKDQFPNLKELYLQTRLHLISAATYFRFAGFDRSGVVSYQFWCFAGVSLFFALFALSHQLRVAAVIGPIVFAVMYAISGFRLEVTGAPLWMAGMAVLYGNFGSRTRGKKSLSAPISMAGKLMLSLAPIAAPSLLAWSLGAILTYDLHQLIVRRARIWQLFLQDLIVLALAVILFLFSIDFNFSEFWSQFFYHASRALGGGIKTEALFRGLGFGVLAWVLAGNGAKIALPVSALALGQLIGVVVHDIGLIRNIVVGMIFLLVIETLFPRPNQIYAWGLGIAASLLLVGNLLLFYIYGAPAGKHAPVILQDYTVDLASPNKVVIDEAMAHHILDHKTQGAIAWTWSNRFPLRRPQSLAELPAGKVWYLSKYTLFSYLKGRHAIARRLAGKVQYETTPQIGCWIGRQSCNYPLNGWGIMRFERVGDKVLITDYDRARVIELL